MYTSKTEITLSQVIEWTQAEINKEGADFVYKAGQREENGPSLKCQYYENGKPSCLIGRMFHTQGIITPADAGAEYHDDSVNTMDSGSLLEFLESEARPIGYTNFTEAALNFLKKLQWGQDDGHAWGDALYAARIYALGMDD